MMNTPQDDHQQTVFPLNPEIIQASLGYPITPKSIWTNFGKNDYNELRKPSKSSTKKFIFFVVMILPLCVLTFRTRLALTDNDCEKDQTTKALNFFALLIGFILCTLLFIFMRQIFLYAGFGSVDQSTESYFDLDSDWTVKGCLIFVLIVTFFSFMIIFIRAFRTEIQKCDFEGNESDEAELKATLALWTLVFSLMLIVACMASTFFCCLASGQIRGRK